MNSFINMKNPFVSVAITTYNSEKYIENAIESVFAQKTDFSFEIVIGEDHSTDKTLEICLNYQKKYPEIIRVILNNHNLGYAQNTINVLNNCRGKYVAILDCDDVWTDRQKLLKQISYLEVHPKCGLCYTNCSIINEIGELISESRLPLSKRRDANYLEFLNSRVPITSTAVIRSDAIDANLLKNFTGLHFDILLFSVIAKNSDSKYLDIITMAYRLHSNSMYSNNDKITNWKTHLDTYKQLLSFFVSDKEKQLISKQINGLRSNLYCYYLSNMNLREWWLMSGELLGAFFKKGNIAFLRANYKFLKDTFFKDQKFDLNNGFN